MIDLPLLYRLEAVSRGVDAGRADAEHEALSQLAESHPDRVAAMVVALVDVCARAGEVRVAGLIDALAARGHLDLSVIATEGARLYAQFVRRGDAVATPAWVMAAKRARSRIAYRRRRETWAG